MTENIVIIGGGQSGVQLCDSLRTEGYVGAITLYASETHLPYQRPPLSKDFIAEGADAVALPLRAERFFADRAVDFYPGISVTSIDLGIKTVTLSDETSTNYSSLVFATGARNRTLTIEGSNLAGIHYLRTLDDATLLRGELAQATRTVVVGAGFIGLEFAAAARQRGLDVTVLEFGPRPMGRVLSEPMSRYFTEAHTRNGISMKLGEGIAAFGGDGGRITSAIGTSGTEYPANIVLVGVGVIPNDELASAAGIDSENGIIVNATLQTSDPDVFALGDCARYPHAQTGVMTRLESVQNATDQAKTLAKTLTGYPANYDSLAWFWSQQGPIKLQIAGITDGHDKSVLRGNLQANKFSIYCFRDTALVGVESVNSPADHMTARRVLTSGFPISPEQIADSGFDLKSHLKAFELADRG
ncbi:NAD(P)/FAD-dependent oxidoreductase [Cryobacterium sp. Y57]|uniref:NAD(P)/FAD-dependent oxidoreductase n=1 Tax=Cryobacterium sp. Y57 TaxID=2048287 RepID=UPI000CE50018|nr:FAD-dependent oxidoreductase [Cryobacterium sp. Y57]